MENGSEVILEIRPEDIYIASEEHPVHSVGKVEVYEMLGYDAIVYLLLEGDKQAVAKISSDCKLKVGDLVKISFDTEKIHVFDKKTEKTITN